MKDNNNAARNVTKCIDNSKIVSFYLHFMIIYDDARQDFLYSITHKL